MGGQDKMRYVKQQKRDHFFQKIPLKKSASIVPTHFLEAFASQDTLHHNLKGFSNVLIMSILTTIPTVLLKSPMKSDHEVRRPSIAPTSLLNSLMRNWCV